MLLDHIGYYYYDLLPPSLVLVLRTIGRLAFPIFAWSVAQGFIRTRNSAIYFIRMTAFALVSEIIIRWSNTRIGLTADWRHPDWTNVLITFSLSIVLLAGFRLARDSYRDMVASLRPIPAAPNTVPVPPRFDVRINIGGISLDPHLGITLGVIGMIAAILAVEWLKADYGWYGLLTVLLFYIAQYRIPEAEWEARSFLFVGLLNVVYVVYRVLAAQTPAYWAVLQAASIMAIPICMAFRRDKKPPLWAKYGFYLFYPLHILVLCLIRAYLVSI